VEVLDCERHELMLANMLTACNRRCR
jgi:hypothetical protein